MSTVVPNSTQPRIKLKSTVAAKLRFLSSFTSSMGCGCRHSWMINVMSAHIAIAKKTVIYVVPNQSSC